jgi:hypothetical protein
VSDKANIVITPINDVYDGNIADRPDEFTSIQFNYANWNQADRTGGDNWFIFEFAPKGITSGIEF